MCTSRLKALFRKFAPWGLGLAFVGLGCCLVGLPSRVAADDGAPKKTDSKEKAPKDTPPGKAKPTTETAPDGDSSEDDAKPAEGAGKKPAEKKEAPEKTAKSAPPVRIVPRQQTLVGKPDEVRITQGALKIINSKLQEAWRENKVQPSHYVDDHEFARRASLDIIGRIATSEELTKYLRYPAPSRRPQIIEDLLAHEDYPKHWGTMWANWLLGRSGVFGRGTYHDGLTVWLEDQFAQNRTYDKLASDLITAKGKNTENPQVNFILAHLGEQNAQGKRDQEGQFEMVPITSRITRLFLGMQLQCAQCHDHPFNNAVTQKHFWGVNTFLRQVEREGTPPAETMRAMTYPVLTLKENTKANSEGLVYYEKRNGVILPTKATFLDSPKPTDSASIARREMLANYVTGHDNFPRALVNRIWSAFMGVGFTTPIDDFNEQNTPALPELLNGVATEFKQYGFDQKRLIRWICNSDMYHLSYSANRTNEKPEVNGLFSRMQLKSMSPEQLFESLMVATKSEATESKDSKQQLRATWLNTLVTSFGDDEGNEVNFNGTVVQALLMMNGSDINTAITRAEKGTVAVAMARNKGVPARVISDLYIAALNRPPRSGEVATIVKKMTMRLKDKEPIAPYQDLFWALLNSNEFMLNH
ncbi:MAG: DUF1549 domain-containing protein [Planctomycetota bacterium]|nr:DUF1549 domain-containing protein [Planctomycetota bacterium]